MHLQLIQVHFQITVYRLTGHTGALYQRSQLPTPVSYVSAPIQVT